MENEVKIFHSDITRVECNENGHLYDLLKITSAQPIEKCAPKQKFDTWEFIPNNDKHYIPRTSSKLKVKTVKEIRSLLEKDVYSYLQDDLHKQEKMLLRKIRDGSSCNESTKSTASKLLLADDPISKSAWQMIVNINPGNYSHSKQFVLWNDKCIQINGSRGGTSKFICNYDLKNYKKRPLKSSPRFRNHSMKSKMGLLRNSLNVKFKPGPLRKKLFLDNSHHKYQMAQIELVKLPKPALEVSPAYGTVLEPPISGFINSLRGETGAITPKLAEFAVSVLGTSCNQTPTQLDKECCVVFDLNYKCDQNRLLMRRNTVEMTCKHFDSDYSSTENIANGSMTTKAETFSNPTVISENEIQSVMNDMLNSVEISLMQDSFYSEDEPREAVTDFDAELNAKYTTKDKPKRRYCELGKLDVTVIKLPEGSQKDYTKPCGKTFCSMGCICESLDCLLSLKQHCGVLDCMFGCRCEASKYNVIELLERDCSEIIPGLMNLDNEINSHLAKEEKKFHHTVIVAGEKSILLKSQKRKLKSSRKYADFYKNMNLKNDIKIKKILTVDVPKLNCNNIEPFCMVHNLYKCFCKGKFTESFVSNINDIHSSKILNKEISKPENEVIVDRNVDKNRPIVLRPRSRKSFEKVKSVSNDGIDDCINLCSDTDDYNLDSFTSARTTCYYGRKYDDGYYKTTNKRILEMEQNDSLLKKKMMRLINGSKEHSPETQMYPKIQDNLKEQDCSPRQDDIQTEDCPPKLDNIQIQDRAQTLKVLNGSFEFVNNDEDSNKSIGKSEISDDDLFSNTTVKNRLKYWLEMSYKNYKERRELGVLKSSLDAPKKGKASLQSWDFILSRYSARKNFFFVSNREPYRTFLAVDGNHPFFANCTNIDDIRFADLHKYPLVIRNLVTISTDAENSFCILRGWDHCWELIGSAVKVIERVAESQLEHTETSESDTLMTQDDSLDNDSWFDQNTCISNVSKCSVGDKVCNDIKEDVNNTERSKWFVMTVENDFTEIQFYKKGFFVTYDGIQRSICLARISGKTVRLSSQARTGKNTAQQFGIYAIPCINECCVFIGPYEVDEPLGIEIVKTFSDRRKLSKTRGVWITTNKVDNMKVIEHPFSFMPSASVSNDDMVTLESGAYPKTSLTLLEEDKETPNSIRDTSHKKMPKIVKPIKIRRTNGFYHLSPKNVLQKVLPNNATLSVYRSDRLKKKPIVIKSPISLLKPNDSERLKNKTQEPSHNKPTTYLKPVAEIAPQVNHLDEYNMPPHIAHIRPIAEIAPQIKITSVYSESDKNDTSKGAAMLILKPEQINKKILANTASEDGIATDIEKFLETSTICIAPQDEVLVISDGEEEVEEITWKNVWIQCQNVPNFGCIRGKINDDKLSFEFPGFKYSDFYTQSEAFDKIIQVLSRKIYIPKHCKLQWKVEENANLKRKMLTPQCLEEKKYLLNLLRENRDQNKTDITAFVKTTRTYATSNIDEAGTSSKSFSSEDICFTTTNKTKIIESLEETSKQLENQSVLLWNQAITKRDEIISSLNALNNLKEGMADTLNDIMLKNKPSDK